MKHGQRKLKVYSCMVVLGTLCFWSLFVWLFVWYSGRYSGERFRLNPDQVADFRVMEMKTKIHEEVMKEVRQFRVARKHSEAAVILAELAGFDSTVKRSMSGASRIRARTRSACEWGAVIALRRLDDTRPAEGYECLLDIKYDKGESKDSP